MGSQKGKETLKGKSTQISTNVQGVADHEMKTNVESVVGGDLRAVVNPIDLNEDEKMKRTKGNITSIQNFLARFL